MTVNTAEQLPADAPSRASFALACAALALLALAAYGRSLGFDFVLLDDDVIPANQHFYTLKGFFRGFLYDIRYLKDGAVFYRPFSPLPNVVAHYLGGSSPWAYHLVSLALHSAVACLALRFLLALGSHLLPAFFLCAAFTVHPVSAQVVCWIAGGNVSFFSALALAALLSALFYLRSGASRYAALHALFFAAAMFVRESAVGLIPATAALPLITGRVERKKAAWLAAAWPAGLLLWYAARSLALGAGLPTSPGTALDSVLSGAPQLLALLGDIFFPFGMNALTAPADVRLLPGAAALAALAAAIFLLPARRGLAAYGVIFYLSFTLPSLLSPYTAVMSYMPHRAYLPFCGVLAFLLSLRPEAAPRKTLLAAAAAVFLASLTAGVQHAGKYRGPEAFWKAMTLDSPSSALGWLGLGNVHLTRGEPAQAEPLYRRAIELLPTYYMAHYNLGMALAASGRKAEALRPLAAAVINKPDFPLPYLLSGSLHEELGDAAGAELLYRQALQLEPRLAAARAALARVLGGSGRQKEALAEYETLLAAEQANAGHWYNSGVQLEALGRRDEAASRYRQAASLDPGLAEARLNLGYYEMKRNRPAQALEEFRASTAARPGFAQGHNGAGLALLALGRRTEAAASFREALRLAPDFADAAANLARARER